MQPLHKIISRLWRAGQVKTTKRSSVSPTKRTLKALRDQGFYAWVVESKVPKTFISRDFMGWADIIYLTLTSIVGVQVTSGDNHAARRAKILAEPRARAWLIAGGLIEVHSWSKQGARGQVKKWVCRKEEIVAMDFIENALITKMLK